jgi:hypothetical protein
MSDKKIVIEKINLCKQINCCFAVNKELKICDEFFIDFNRLKED